MYRANVTNSCLSFQRPNTFKDFSRSSDVARRVETVDTKTPYQIKAYRAGFLSTKATSQSEFYFSLI